MNLIVRNRDLESVKQMDRFQRELSRWFDTGFDNLGLFDRALNPSLDVVENAEGYQVYVDLPGVDKKDISLTVENNLLTLEGEKKESAEKDKKRFFRRETWAGTFRRTIALPTAADGEKVQAQLQDGVLTISIGKKEELKPRQIAVNVR